MSSDGAWHKMRKEWRDVKQGWRLERAEQPGWTHELAQRVRTLCRKGPVIAAHLILVLATYALLSLVAVAIWAALTVRGD